MDKIYKSILLTILIGMLSLLTISSVSANEVTINYVNSDGIEGAISKGNTTINLQEGTYKGEKNTNITINSGDNITIQSKDPNKKATIDGQNMGQFIFNNGNLTLKNLIIKNCAMDLGGALYNRGNLKIFNCIFINNVASSDTGSGSGGVIFNERNSNLTIENSTFSNNYAPLNGGAIANNGGNINISGSTFIQNSANLGGAIRNIGNLSVSYSYFVNNSDRNNNTIENRNGSIGILDFNWWGSNSNPNTMINGTSVNNYYTIIVNEIKVPSILQNATYKINFVLNNTNNIANSEKLPKISFNIYLNGYLLGNYQFNENINIEPKLGTNVVFLIPTIAIENNLFSVTEEIYYKVFDIAKLKSQITLNSIKGSYHQTITLTTKLISNGKVLVGKKVNFYVNGKLIGTATTNKDGIAKLKYKIPSVAKYTVKTVFTGDSQYNKIESTKTFTSTKAKVTMQLKNKLYKNRIYVKISALGKPLKNKVIKVYVKGKYVGKVKTNSKGIALFKYSKKYGKVKVQTLFSGDKLYSRVYKTSKIKL